MQERRSRPPSLPVPRPAQPSPVGGRSLVTDILALQLVITGAIAAIAIGGLAWTSGSVVEDNLTDWAEVWSGELNELGAPFYLSDADQAIFDVGRFVAKYPEIQQVTWYTADGSVLDFIDQSGTTDAGASRLEPDLVEELSRKAGEDPAYLLAEDANGARRFRLSSPIWTERFSADGLFGLDADAPETAVELLGFVVVSLDFSSYHNVFESRLVLATLVLMGLFGLSWFVGRLLLKRGLRPLSELQEPLAEIAHGRMDVGFPISRHRETRAIVTALSDTLRALEKREEHLRHLANHDPVTGLYSRHRLTAELEAASAAWRSGNDWTALCFIDLDQFKYVNDTCGHPAGDQVLKLASDQIRRAVRSDDFVCRFGGDEFIVLLREVTRHQAGVIAERILEQMRSFRYVEQGQTFHVQCSIGVASINFSRFTAHEVIAQADMACQTAKTLGRNRAEFYKVSGKQGEMMMQDVAWTRIIRDALEGEGFVLYYQPLMHIRTGRVSHYEVLLRLQTENGLTGPLSFLPAATRFGLMGDIDQWVVRNAVQALSRFRLVQPGLRFSINLSSFSLDRESFADEVRDLLREYSIPGDHIVFEITEQVAVRFAVETDKQIAKLRELGCRIAIDDFGTGYSSFSYLKHLPVDYLKIDGSFIRSLTQDAVDQSMVRMVGEVARAAGIQTVAEYVQSEDILSMLAQLGIDYAQGFHIGRPAPDLQTSPDPTPHPEDTRVTVSP
jgi:diguanylate cyclase (GGDEF)-like protein